MSNINEIKLKHQYIKNNFDFDLFEIEHNVGLCYGSFMWNDLPSLKKLIKSILSIIPHQSDCIIGVDVSENISNIVINVSLTNMWDKSIKESFNITYKNKPEYQKDFLSSGDFLKTENMKTDEEVSTLPTETLTDAIENWDNKYETATLENAAQNILNKDKSDTLTKLRSAYYGSEEYLKNTQAWHDLPEKTEIQHIGPISMIDMVSQPSYDYETNTKQTVKQEPKYGLPKYSEFESTWEPKVNIQEVLKTYNYTGLQYIIQQCCANNTPNFSKDKLIKDITLAITPKLLSQSHVIEVVIQNGCSENDIVANVNIFSDNKKIFNTSVTYKSPEPLQSEVESMNTSTNKNYREHITNLIHKVTHERSWYYLDRTQRLEKLSALISLYMELFRDFEFTEITDEDSSLLHDYIYNVSIVNTKTNVCETIRVTGRFETEKNKNCIMDLEHNWLVQEEIPLSAPVKSAYTYDGSDTKYNAYCRVKQLYSGYGCGQPNEKIEIQSKEGTNYPAFLTKTDMGVLRTLTNVYLLSGEIIYDNYVCEQARQVLVDKRIKIVRKEKLVDTYFYISNQSESVWAKVFILELLKPTIEKPVTKTVSIDYEQLQILIKSYNDNGGNITYDYDSDRLIEGIDHRL